MLTLLFFLIYLAVTLLLTALLYFPVFQALDAIWEVRPDRVFYRLAMIIAILGFWPFLRLLRIDNLDALGYSMQRRIFMRTFVTGLGVGVIIMTVHIIFLLILGTRVPQSADMLFSRLPESLLNGLFSGILVAFIEETFFRGAMYYHMRRNSRQLTTLVITSLFYAAVHFTRPPPVAEASGINWDSGFGMLLEMLHQYKDFAGIADSFIALFCAGLFLCLVRERTGNIALCLGIHAGWVLIIKLAREVTVVDIHSPMAFLIGSYDTIIGLAATGLLVLITLWYWRYGAVKNRDS